MATTDMQRLVVALEARTAAFEKAMNRANGVANRRARSIESRFMALNRNVASGFAAVGRQAAVAFAAIGGARGLKSLTDAAIGIDNALKIAGVSGEELEGVYQRLKSSAMANAAPLEALVELYGRAALVQKELGISGEELLGFTDKIAVALRVSGKSASESSGALLQLSQALGSGVVRAEEFNAILEGALPIAQAAASGLKEAGGSVAKLRQLVVEGKISSEAFFRAFEAGAPILEDKVSGAVFTIDQRLGNLKTALVDAARRFNESSNAANTFGTAIDNVTDFVNNVDFDALIEEIGRVIGQFQAGVQWAKNFASTIGQVTGADALGEFLTGGEATRSFLGGALTVKSEKVIRDRIDGAFENIDSQVNSDIARLLQQRYGGGEAAAPKTGRIGGGSKFEPVSLKDFAPPDGKGSGGSKSKRDSFQREIEQIRERTAALQAETAAMAGLNPLVDDYGYAVERARAQQELLAAAQKAGIAITPELRAQIDNLAEGYANATVAANQLAESQDRARETAEEMRSLGKDVLGGFINDLRAGKTGAEALAGALNKVADKLLDIALNSIFDSKGGGLFSGLFSFIPKLFGFEGGGIAARGKPVMGGKPLRRFARGGVSREAAIFGEAGAEAAVPLPDGRSIPVTLSVPKVPQMAQSMPPQEVRITGVFVDDNGVIKASISQSEQRATRAGAALGARQVSSKFGSLMANEQARSF